MGNEEPGIIDKLMGNVPDMTLEDLLVQKMQLLLDMEKDLVKALAKMAEAATDSELKKGFQDHGKQTEGHMERVTQAFEILGKEPKGMMSEGIHGIILEAEWMMRNVRGKAALDAALVACAGCAEHFEIASYATAIGWATELGYDDIVKLFEQNLKDEMAADEKMSKLGGKKLFPKADMDV